MVPPFAMAFSSALVWLKMKGPENERVFKSSEFGSLYLG